MYDDDVEPLFPSLFTRPGHGCNPDAEAGVDDTRNLPDDVGKSLPFEPVSQQHSRRGRHTVGQRVASTAGSPGTISLHRQVSCLAYKNHRVENVSKLVPTTIAVCFLSF